MVVNGQYQFITKIEDRFNQISACLKPPMYFRWISVYILES